MPDSKSKHEGYWHFALALLLCVCLVAVSLAWPQHFSQVKGAADSSLAALLGGGSGAKEPPMFTAAWAELVKLIAAGLVGIMVTIVHRRYRGASVPNRSLMQAAVLLCISGALMMIIIGNSTARALGIAGGASIIRFRTPVEDPKDAILLFIVLALGMASGLGAFAVTGLATLFLCLFLAFLDYFGHEKPRSLNLDLVAAGRDFPLEHVQTVLRGEVDFFEPLRVVQGTEAAMRFLVKVNPTASLAWISDQLMAGGTAGLKSVSWEPVKKSAE